MYQVDAAAANDDDGPRQVRGIDLSTSTYPIFVGYDFNSGNIYWHDDGPVKSSIKFKQLSDTSSSERSLSSFSPGTCTLVDFSGFSSVINFRSYVDSSFAGSYTASIIVTSSCANNADGGNASQLKFKSFSFDEDCKPVVPIRLFDCTTSMS